MPYPIPEDLNEIEGWRWYLVPLPDNDEMIRVAWGMWSELTNYWMWGEEGPVPELSNQAAQIWAQALYEAWRVREMGFPDNLLEAIDEVEGLLEAIRDKPCCEGDFQFSQTGGDGLIDIDDVPPGDDVIVGVGDPPGDVEDWPAYNAKLCDAATKFAEFLPTWFDYLSAISSLATIGLAGLAAFYLPFLAGIGIVASSVAGVLGSALTALSFLEKIQAILGTDDPYDTEKAEIEHPDTQQALICAIVESTTLEAAVAAVQSALATHAPNAAPHIGDLPLSWIVGRYFNMESDASAGFGGGCGDCSDPAYDLDLTWTFDSNSEDWSAEGKTKYDATNDDIAFRDEGFLGAGRVFISRRTILDHIDGPALNTVIQPLSVQFDVWREASSDSGGWKVQIVDELGSADLRTFAESEIPDSKLAQETFLIDLTGRSEITITDNGVNWLIFNANIDESDWYHIDNVRLLGSIVD